MGWNSTVVDNKMSTKDLRDFVIDEFYYDINIVYRSNRGNNIYLAYTHKLYGGFASKFNSGNTMATGRQQVKISPLTPMTARIAPRKSFASWNLF